jgi:hypothetical protein
MRFLHDPHLRLNTIHIRDASRAMVKVADWIANVGRAAADQAAGEEIPSAWTWSTGKEGDQEKQGLRLVPDLLDTSTKIIAPYFNVVSGGL